ncbi:MULTISPECIES: zinc-dependent metalloprotease [Gammaproteobacteria]|uniref:zinc-dependent metalloprotease n=1 Tax=Gammaproteobacteria TaxID=1236 RepID=UPI000DD04DD0|nr:MULTISPECIES: zinc-dependent metalloprotease [Gammaproteobacteria]RTE86619.1 DUF5117 domain-containing protein [Aliidiomarina sp. B3213]TCZ90826.1 DUF5117 domain-containing protein [Lysobacter sp. N42]
MRILFKLPLVTLILSCLLLINMPLAEAQEQSIEEFTESLERREGFFNLYVDQAKDRVYLEVPENAGAFIFQSSLPRGVGSNDLGLDRGQLGATRLAHFSFHGERALLIEKNTQYRAITENQAERLSVQEAFAESTLFGFDIVAKTDGRVLLDYTPFLYTDIHGISTRLQSLNEGQFRVDPSRSVLWLERTKSFPRNTELEAKVTFSGSQAGYYLRSVTPDSSALTVHLHHSFIALPPEDYEPRAFHPNSGLFPNSFQDYAVPLQQDMTTQYVRRHRLEKANPSAERSEAIEPIIYYLDPGVPEPVRTALIEGGEWWNEAFEDLGFINAFQIRDLPADADPMDVRYNVIQWVHRATRGWSYGYSVVDPRTGEILKGHVTLGSLRVRQDMRIAQGLLAPFSEEKDTEALLAEIERVALHRIRQLSAHEIGHTLGIAHNFASNSQNRASVMDYPHPLIELNEQGEVTLQNAYATGMGIWDKFTVAYAYSEFADQETERRGLTSLLEQAREQDLHFISDRDARAAHGGHPTAHLWNNGANATDELNRLVNIRSQVLNQFGLSNIAEGQPLSDLEHVLVPMFYLHRYQVEAAAKLVAGVHYRYYVTGEQPVDHTMVSSEQQQAAIDALLNTLGTDFLTIPQSVQQLLVPNAYGSYDSREDFPGRMGLFNDPVTIAEASANHTLQLLFHPLRLNRLQWQHANDASIPSPAQVARQALQATWDTLEDVKDPISQRTAYVTAYQIFQTSMNSNTAPEVRAALQQVLRHSADKLADDADSWRYESSAFSAYLARLVNQALIDQEWPEAFAPAELPPGSPI